MKKDLFQKITFLYIVFAGLSQSPAQAQSDSLPTRNIVYAQGGGQALSSLHYEFDFLHSKYYFLGAQGGYGGFPGDHDPPHNNPRHNIFFTGLNAMTGIKPIYIVAGIDPMFYLVGKTSFINIDGDFGLRFQRFAPFSLFFQITYTPIIYTNHNNDFDVPFAFALGLTF